MSLGFVPRSVLTFQQGLRTVRRALFMNVPDVRNDSMTVERTGSKAQNLWSRILQYSSTENHYQTA
jgi:hypothetical protein